MQSAHFRCGGLALPDDQHLPSKPPQRRSMQAVSFSVAIQLRVPISGMRLGPAAAAIAGMQVPKTPVDEDDFPQPGKHEIGLARQAANVQTIPISHAVDHSANDHFRSGVFSLHRRHDPRTNGFGYGVSHAGNIQYAPNLGAKQGFGIITKQNDPP